MSRSTKRPAGHRPNGVTDRTKSESKARRPPEDDPEVANQHDCKPRYKVGFGQPPKHSRFKAGQSGNPRGRVREHRNLRTILKQVLGEDMQTRQGDRVRRMPRLEALVRTTLAKAFKGDPKAFASLGFLMRQSGYGEDRDEPTAADLLNCNSNSIIADFLERSIPTELAVSEGTKEGEDSE